MLRKIIMIIFCLTTGLAVAQIYRWVDGDGNVHFSDKPVKGAKAVDLPPVQTYSPPPVTPASATKSEDSEKAKVFKYKSIEITQPQPEETIRVTDGRVPVTVQINPNLREGDSIEILYDGAVLKKDTEAPKQSTSFILTNVLRGSHTVQAQILDEKGEVMKQSEIIEFFMHTPRAGMSRPSGGSR